VTWQEACFHCDVRFDFGIEDVDVTVSPGERGARVFDFWVGCPRKPEAHPINVAAVLPMLVKVDLIRRRLDSDPT
jgi:hypothetical protein